MMFVHPGKKVKFVNGREAEVVAVSAEAFVTEHTPNQLGGLGRKRFVIHDITSGAPIGYSFPTDLASSKAYAALAPASPIKQTVTLKLWRHTVTKELLVRLNTSPGYQHEELVSERTLEVEFAV